jgi:multidrug transporter EmrE-like cation transporter
MGRPWRQRGGDRRSWQCSHMCRSGDGQGVGAALAAWPAAQSARSLLIVREGIPKGHALPEMKYALLFGTIAALALGQVLFKLAVRTSIYGSWAFLTSPVFIIALIVYAGATLSWMFVLKEFPITVAYPATALAIVLVLLAGVVMFGEPLRAVQGLGAAAILVGLMLLALG